MPYITLTVTSQVINNVKQRPAAQQNSQKQLAIQGSSYDFSKVSAQNRVIISICGVFNLTVGDTGAIWKVHQNDDVQAGDFSDIYSLLERRPDVPVTFKW